MRQHKESERIRRELEKKHGLSANLGNQANVLFVRGELDEAMRLHKEGERIYRELGDKNGLQRSLGNQALILEARGELDQAMKLHKEEERICRKLENYEGLANSLINQALLLVTLTGRRREALLPAEEAYHLAIKHGLVAKVKYIKPRLNMLRLPILFQLL